jgi:PAS domain S-box-containing protein
MTIINEDLRSNGKKRAGQKVQGHLQLLPLIMNNIPQAVFWKDKDLVYLGCNQAFADDAGFASPEDIVGKTDFDMPWKEQADLYRADDRLVMENAKPKLNYEEPQTTPDGSRIWLSTSKIPVYENDQVVAVLGMYEDITERKRGEEALKEERQRFQTILETIRVPTIISRLSDGIVLYANEAIAQVSQVNLNKLIGFKTGSFYANPDDRQIVLESLREHGHINDFEVQFRRTDGSLYWALLSSRIVDYENERCVLSTYIDITERKQAEVIVQESRARFQGLVETLSDWIWEVDQNGIYTYVSPKIKDLLGYEPEEIVGKTPFDLMPPDEAQRVAGVFGPLLSAQQPLVALENANVHKDGHLVVFETSGTPFFDINGNLKGYRGTDRDITERKRAEQILQQSEATLSSALRVAKMGHWEFDIPTQMFTFNEQYYSLHGRTAQEVGGYQMNVQRFAQEFVYPEDAPSVGQATQQAIETTDPDFHIQIEARILHADGKPRWVTIWFGIEKDAQGRTIKLHGVNQDITARKELEAQIQEAFELRGLQVQLSTQVSQSIASTASLEELYERVVTQVKEQFGYYHTQLLRYDPAQEAVVLVTGYGEVGAKMLASRHRLPMGEGLIGTAAASGETVLRSALEYDPDWHAHPLLPETKGEIAVPIKLGERVLGVLDVQSNRAGALDADDQLLLEGLCGQIATAIESTRLRQEMAEKLEEINRLYRAMSREAWQNYQGSQNIVTGFMFDQAGLRPVKDIDLTDELFANIPLVVPGGEVIGKLAVADDPQRPISTEDETFLQQVSEQLSLALESARLFEQTEQQRGQLNEALDIARLANWEYDVARDRFIFNDHFYSIFHTTVQEVGGYEVSSEEYAKRFVHPDDMPMVGQEIGKALSSTDRHYNTHLEHRILYADGGVGYISADVHIERDEQGNILRYYGANQDITERKKAEMVIQESEVRLSEALEIARLANWEYDLERDIFTFNDQFYSIFHTTVDKVGGYELSSARYAELFVHPDDGALVGEEIGKVLASTDRQYTKQLEHRILYADGGVGYISVNINIERDESGKITRWYGANQDITERKKAEMVIQESEARLSEALEIARLANWEYDVARDRFMFNDHFYSIFHTTVQEVGGYEVSSEEYAKRFVHPDDVPMVGQEIGKALSSTDRHYNVQLEHRILYADGGVGYISVNVHIERDEQGNILRYYGANQDITERKLAEEAVKAEQQRTQAALIESRETQKLIRNVIDSTDDWIFVKDREHRYQLVNQGYAKALHISVEDFIGKTDLDLGFPEELVKGNPEKGIRGFWSDDALVMGSGMPQHFPDDPATIDGQVHIFDTIKVPLRDESGYIWGVLAFARDVTERKNAETIIAQRAAQLATVASLSSTTSTLLDPDQLLQTVVDLTKERFGLYHAHIYLADESWNTLLLAAGAGEVGRQMVVDGWNIPIDHDQSIVASAARNRESVIANDVVRDTSSTFLSNQLLPDTRSEMAVPMIVGQKLLGVFDVQADAAGYFTEEDANVYTTLAAQVAVALQNARLYKEQAATVTQLRELDKLKSSFLANMSHELRTPLNSILGFTDVIMEGLDGPLTEHMDNDLRLIQKNGQHLLHLINDVLDMAKIEAGRMNLSPENFKAFEVMEEVTNITSTLASEKNLALFIEETSEQNVEIYADRTRLRQVMINLVNNAIKFTEAGKISLKVVSMPGARVLITVQDTGIGIAPDKLDAIFLEFTQVDASSTRKAGGTGLGLPISRRLVEMHGGRLWAESTGIPGEGSTFFVELPIEARISEVVEKQAS